MTLERRCPALLLHGAGLGSWIWATVKPLLTIDAEAVDLPGRGPGARPNAVTLRDCVDYVEALLLSRDEPCVLVDGRQRRRSTGSRGAGPVSRSRRMAKTRGAHPGSLREAAAGHRDSTGAAGADGPRAGASRIETIDSGHLPMLLHPVEMAEMLNRTARQLA